MVLREQDLVSFGGLELLDQVLSGFVVCEDEVQVGEEVTNKHGQAAADSQPGMLTG